MPTSTDLVTDLPADFEVFGQAVDTSLADLKGGTTGQVLAKNSNTDMDFTWTAIDPLVILDAKGDLITATAADTPARLAVGTNGQVLTADSTTATGLKWATAAAGGMTQLATGTLSGATTTISGISGSYKDLQIIVRNFDPTSDGGGLSIRMNSDSTASRHLTSSTYGQWQAVAFNTTAISVTADVDNAVNQGLVRVTIYDYANTATWKMCDFVSISNNPTTSTQSDNRVGYGLYNQTSAITSIDFLTFSGTMAGGTYFLYGVN